MKTLLNKLALLATGAALAGLLTGCCSTCNKGACCDKPAAGAPAAAAPAAPAAAAPAAK